MPHRGLLHIDIKKLGCIGRIGHRIHGDRRRSAPGVGWEFVHVAIDDHSRLAFSRIFTDEKHTAAIAFLRAAVQYYAALGIRIERVASDNGSCYRSHAFRQVCTELGIRQRFTRPYRPCTNGKAERFIQTLLREWTYAAAYNHSTERAAHLPHGYTITTGIVLTVVWMTTACQSTWPSIGITSLRLFRQLVRHGCIRSTPGMITIGTRS